MSKSVKRNLDVDQHLKGGSIFVDDMSVKHGTLFCSVLFSECAHAKNLEIDSSEAQNIDGVVAILTAKDIPGENEIGGIILDEPLLAEDDIHFWGQPIALVIASTQQIAKKARKSIKLKYTELDAITTAQQAKEKEHFICPPREFNFGNVEKGFDECEYVFEGKSFSNGQEHLYLETQGCYAELLENDSIKLYSSTQGPTVVQRVTARVLGIPMHKIEVDVTRLGGGFGGKEDQATPWAVLAALAAQHTKTSCKLILDRHDDLKVTGKRHPYESEFKIGLDKNFKILAYQAQFLQNSGAAADLSTAIAERTLFHATNSYFIPNVKTKVFVCKTHLPPNTAFRGFGGPQGKFVIESAIALAAQELKVPNWKIQRANLIKEGQSFYYGQKAEKVNSENCWNQLEHKQKIELKQQSIDQFNQDNSQYKKGLSVMPICFGISFTNTPMNHARALVHIYQDGSVGISTGAVEMGQGVNSKMVHVAAESFKIDKDLIKIETTNTTRVANTSPSAASATADLNGKALEIACQKLKDRLLAFISIELKADKSQLKLFDNHVYIGEKKSNIEWKQLIFKAFWDRVCLSENAHYATPIINFDKTKESGHPFAYHVYGTALTEVTIDCLRGTYEVDSVDIVHDFGKSMIKGIDYGQVEGALVQGIGWMTMEEIAFNDQGKLLSNTLSTYKIPDIFSIPKNIRIDELKTDGHELAIMKSKAVGEPPLMYGIGTYFALENAISAFNSDYKKTFHSPMTVEKVLMKLNQTE